MSSFTYDNKLKLLKIKDEHHDTIVKPSDIIVIDICYDTINPRKILHYNLYFSHGISKIRLKFKPSDITVLTEIMAGTYNKNYPPKDEEKEKEIENLIDM